PPDIVVGKEKFTRGCIPPCGARLNRFLLNGRRLGIGVAEEGGCGDARISRPETDTDELRVTTKPEDASGVRRRFHLAARITGQREVERSPEKVQRRRPSAEAGSMLF